MLLLTISAYSAARISLTQSLTEIRRFTDGFYSYSETIANLAPRMGPTPTRNPMIVHFVVGLTPARRRQCEQLPTTPS